MPEINDTYKTISKPTEGLFKDRGSKFIAYAYPVNSEDDIKEALEAVKKEHHQARHHCYAYYLGPRRELYRANDDGEPSNSAGKPILGQLQSYDVTNLIVVVVRYFGGVKLGVGGLINAYRSAAADALEKAKIVEKTINATYRVDFAYDNTSEVMRVINELNLNIVKQEFEIACKLWFEVRERDEKRATDAFEKLENCILVKEK